MDQQTIATSETPEVIIDQIGGSLQVKGWERAEVEVRANPSDLSMDAQEDVVRLSCRGSCTVRLPQGAALRVEAVSGEARFKLLEDQLSIGAVHGSLILRNVAGARVETVHGHLMAKNVAGDLLVERVAGNASARNVQGQCLLEEVQGNLDVRDIESDIRSEVHGNARLRLSQMLGENYQIQTRGNMHGRLPEDASLRLSITSQGQDIQLKLPNGTQNIRQETFTTTVGEGEAVMEIAARGSVYLSVEEVDWADIDDQAEDFEDFGRVSEDFSQQIAQQVEAQIEAQMAAMTSQLNEQMARLSESISRSGMSEEETERILRRARETSERATANAQEKMRRAQEKLERKLESTRRRNEMKAQAAERRTQGRGRRSWNVDWSTPQPPPPAKQQVSDEERLMILRMLEQKKITIEEAEELLSALEGKDLQ